MKKLIIILAAVFSFTAASAQYRNDNNYDRHQAGQWNNNRGYDRDDRYNRQVEYDRMNRDYDRRIDNYRRDRSLSRYERQRRIEEAERERQQKAKSFGKGVIVGGIAAIVLGAILSN